MHETGPGPTLYLPFAADRARQGVESLNVDQLLIDLLPGKTSADSAALVPDPVFQVRCRSNGQVPMIAARQDVNVIGVHHETA